MINAIMKKMDDYGFAVIAVGSDHENNLPSFSYTVGLTKYGYQEVIVFGLPIKVTHTILNDIGNYMIDNKCSISTNKFYDQFANFPIMFIDVQEKYAGEYTPILRRFFNDSFKVVQLVWPDKNGKMPYSKEYDSSLDTAQPLLGLFSIL